MKTRSVIYASDDRGTLMLAISVYSMLKHAKDASRYSFTILDDGMSEVSQAKITGIVKDFGASIQFISISEHLSSFVSIEYSEWPSAAYGRVLAPMLLADVDTVLYIDIDTLIMQDVAPIFDIDMGDKILAAVYQKQNAMSDEWLRRLEIPEDYAYFNSGVLLMNLAQMRQEQSHQLIMDYVREHEKTLNCPDQDVLNALFYKRTIALHPKWNWHSSQSRKLLFFKKNQRSCWGNCSAETMFEAACYPHIIHFIGRPKPTDPCNCFYAKEYRQTWLESPAKDIPMSRAKFWKFFFKGLMYAPYYALIRLKIRRMSSRAPCKISTEAK